MYIGVDYYPEHWQEERWETDARLMREAGFNVVRLAEFAWSKMEPEEGVFDFAWLDRALAVLHQHGIAAVLGTPTAVMPAWVQHKYPEVMATEKDGTRIVWGVRKNNCFTSGTFRMLSERITQAMAAHFKDTKNVIGWQTDNEFGHPVCYCETCRAEFQEWLHCKYGSLNELNRAWGNHFWGLDFNNWGHIPVPTDPSRYNPGACLDWQRFFSWLNVRFQADQLRILRQSCPEHFITHNFMGLFSELNYYDLAADLDFVSWDNYPIGQKLGEIHYKAAAGADLMRGLKSKNFWIMEQTAGPAGWSCYTRNPRHGEIRKISYQQLAHGADGQVWFRWRTCTAGREQYWHGLLGHDGRPLRRYQEAARTAAEYHRLAPHLKNTTVKAEAAIIYDYDSIWAVRIQPGFSGNTCHEAISCYYNALLRAGVNVDMIPATADFSKYKTVFAPDLYVMPDALAKRLDAYVKKGGVLVTDCRCGVKDESGLCHERTLPGLLSEALGIIIEEYESISDNMASYPVCGSGGITGEFTGTMAADWVKTGSAEKLAGYTGWHMLNYAAATRNRYGKGTGFYVGTVVKETGFYDQLISQILQTAQIKPVLTPPEGVEISVRSGGKRRILFIINHTEEDKTVSLPENGGLNLLTGKKQKGSVKLDKYDVAVIKLGG